MRRGMEAISLWHCSGVMEAQVALIAPSGHLHWFCASPLFLQTSGMLISKWKAKFAFIWKEGFGPLSNSPVLFLFSPGKKLLSLFLFQKWLSSPFPEDVWAWWLLMHWLQYQFTLCEALPRVWISFAWQYSQACGHPYCWCTFSYPISSFQFTLHLIYLETALIEQPPLSVMALLWLILFVEGVNDCLLDHCQVSSVPHDCGLKEQDIPRIYTVWLVIYWNSNVNILILWDTDFWLSFAVSSNHEKKRLKCFTLHVMNLKYIKVSLFEITYKKKIKFSPYLIFLDVHSLVFFLPSLL